MQGHPTPTNTLIRKPQTAKTEVGGLRLGTPYFGLCRLRLQWLQYLAPLAAALWSLVPLRTSNQPVNPVAYSPFAARSMPKNVRKRKPTAPMPVFAGVAEFCAK
jgi:hypothetical protein